MDLSDNYIEGDGAKAIATVLKENMFIVNLVRLCYKSVVSVHVISPVTSLLLLFTEYFKQFHSNERF